METFREGPLSWQEMKLIVTSSQWGQEAEPCVSCWAPIVPSTSTPNLTQSSIQRVLNKCSFLFPECFDCSSFCKRLLDISDVLDMYMTVVIY